MQKEEEGRECLLAKEKIVYFSVTYYENGPKGFEYYKFMFFKAKILIKLSHQSSDKTSF